MKKKIALIAALAALASLAGCGAQENSSSSAASTAQSSAAAPVQSELSEMAEELEEAAEIAESTEAANDPLGDYLTKVDLFDMDTGEDYVSGHIKSVYSHVSLCVLDDKGDVYLFERPNFDHKDQFAITKIAENTELESLDCVYHSVMTILTNERGSYLFSDSSHIYEDSKKIEVFDDLHNLFMVEGVAEAAFYGIDNSNNLRPAMYTRERNPEKDLYELCLSTAYDITNVKDLAGGFCIDSTGKIFDLNNTNFFSSSLLEDGRLSTRQSLGGTEDLKYAEYEKTPLRLFSAQLITGQTDTALVLNEDGTLGILGTSMKIDGYAEADLSSIADKIVNIYPVTKKSLIIETTDGYCGWSKSKGITSLDMLNGRKILDLYNMSAETYAVMDDNYVYNCGKLLSAL